MAKIRHNNFMDSIDEVISSARDQGVVHLYADDKTLTGRTISINNKKMFHFGTTGYLGLEQDIRLKSAAARAIFDFGTQFPLSKTYISHPLYSTLEKKLEEMYGQPIIVTKNSTLGHLAVIPTVVRDEDAIVLDHQVHWSVQNACQILKTRGVPVHMIRHNNMDMLESKLKELSNKANKIWYMADGVYSMFGDYAPLEDLMTLSKNYPQLHLYIDDVHGMSWCGKHGTGFVSSQLKVLPPNMILMTTLSKTFGASGAVVVCPNLKHYHAIKNFGGPLTFSAQLEPASVAAAIASAEIHLSKEIYLLQNELKDNILFFNQLLRKTELPLVHKNDSPVFYIGTGMPATGYNFVNRLMNDGFFINLGLFPAVPVKNTGVRITIARHNGKEEIKALMDAMSHHFPIALKETQTTSKRVFSLFKMSSPVQEKKLESNSGLQISYTNDIENIDPHFWDKYLASNNICDWNGIYFLQKTFSNNKEKEHNWDFHFFIVKDYKNIPVLITFFTTAIWKDDMMSLKNISQKIEKIRLEDKYFATNLVTSMGSLFSEGKHHYTDFESKYWKVAWLEILNLIESKKISDSIVLRDFCEEETVLNDFFNHAGFFKVQMPEACIIPEINWRNKGSFLMHLSKKSRKHFQRDIEPYIHKVRTEVKNILSESELKKCYQLFVNVTQRNIASNTFTYPQKVFESMNQSSSWEFILLYSSQNANNNVLLGVMFCYKNRNEIYVPSLVGLDYEHLEEFQSYRQLLYLTVMRATEANFKSIDFGISANFEKKKIGASIIPLHGFVQIADTFPLDSLEYLG